MDVIFAIHILALLFSFFVAGALLGALFSKTFRDKLADIVRETILRQRLERSARNPILRPGTSPWTAEAVLNPAAAFINGRTHLIYRAIGMDGVSRLGYASSPDGVVFDERLPYPVYVAHNPRNLPGYARRYSPVLYPSGGSWGGCEDPRMVVIDSRVHITFNMFDGWEFIRVAVISIAQEDFLARRVDVWSGPVIISPPRERHKNWILFPEKIRGKFAVLHSIAPGIEIAYRDSIAAIGTTEPFIDSWEGPRDCLPKRDDCWDSFIRSAGPPPLKTPQGWLLLYHAINERDRGRYKIGAMLLDLDDPTRVLYRAATPILSPDEPYENQGKPGIVYACGAVIREGTLFVYYGGADKVICVATAPLAAFVDAIIAGSQPSFASMTLAQTV